MVTSVALIGVEEGVSEVVVNDAGVFFKVIAAADVSLRDKIDELFVLSGFSSAEGTIREVWVLIVRRHCLVPNQVYLVDICEENVCGVCQI